MNLPWTGVSAEPKWSSFKGNNNAVVYVNECPHDDEVYEVLMFSVAKDCISSTVVRVDHDHVCSLAVGRLLASYTYSALFVKPTVQHRLPYVLVLLLFRLRSRPSKFLYVVQYWDEKLSLTVSPAGLYTTLLYVPLQVQCRQLVSRTNHHGETTISCGTNNIR